MATEIMTYQPGPALEDVSDDVWDLLCAVDNEFVPPLSKRTSTTSNDLQPTGITAEAIFGGPVSYYEPLMHQPLAIARLDGNLAGLVSWIDNFEDQALATDFSPSMRITTIATHPHYTLRGVATAMIGEVRQHANKSTTGWIVARASSESSAIPMFNKTGFQEILRLPDHRGEGVDTIYLASRNE